jgi:hypothetical protein
LLAKAKGMASLASILHRSELRIILSTQKYVLAQNTPQIFPTSFFVTYFAVKMVRRKKIKYKPIIKIMITLTKIFSL